MEIENEDFEAFDNPAQDQGTPLANCDPSEEEESPESEGLNGGYWSSTGLSTRPRNSDPQYVFMAQIEALNDLADQYDLFDRKLDKAIKDLESKHPGDNALHLRASSYMALTAQKDMSWKRTLAGPQRNSAIEAFDKELSSLEGTILTRLEPGTEEYEKARKESTSGRFLLDVKRSGKMKARGIKQGFKEDKETADGFDFNYYSHVAKLTSARTTIFRPNRKGRRLALKDVSTAFLQSLKYPEGMVKYLSMKHPITGEILYFKQNGPIYGEASAPVRWENTIGPWLEEQGFERENNEKSVFYNKEQD